MVGPSVRIMAVVKADAYGHGAAEVAKAALQADPSCALGVATAQEAVTLRSQLPEADVFLLSPCPREALADVARCGAIPVMSRASDIACLDRIGAMLQRALPFHLEVDTGMCRNGLHIDELPRAAEAIRRCRHAVLQGVMTHFPDAEGNPERTRSQVRRFREAANALGAMGLHPNCLHACNTAGLLAYPEAWFDMVRPGLGVYGLLPELPCGKSDIGLVPALSLRARVLLTKWVRAGSVVSYGSDCVVRRRTRLAVLGIGYGDGYPRSLSGIGSALIRGQCAPVLGRVCMDVTIVDVTDLQGVRVGDMATLIGQDGDLRIHAEDLARASATTEHEITTRLSPRLPRLYRPVLE